MLEKAVTKKSRIVNKLAIRRVREWTNELMTSYSYIGLLKKLSDALRELNHLSFEPKQEASELLEHSLYPKSEQKSIIPFS